MTSRETPFDPADYDTDDRVKCRACGDWGWGDEEPKVCPECEERYCAACMPTHNCFTEGPS